MKQRKWSVFVVGATTQAGEVDIIPCPRVVMVAAGESGPHWGERVWRDNRDSQFVPIGIISTVAVTLPPQVLHLEGEIYSNWNKFSSA